MNIITYTLTLNSGITIAVPSYDPGDYVTCDIYYCVQNPVFDFINCDNPESQIYHQLYPSNPLGLIFNYQVDNLLPYGFYRVVISVNKIDSTVSTGQRKFAVLSDMNLVTIGYPYSVYGPILVS